MPKKPAPLKPPTKTPAPKKAAPLTLPKVKAAELSAAGASVSEVARACGLSKTTAWRMLRAEETQQVVITLVNSELDVLNCLLRRAFTVLEDAMTADRPTLVDKKGNITEGGPDHFARLTAVRELRAFLTAGRPKPKSPEPVAKRGLSLEELEREVDARA